MYVPKDLLVILELKASKVSTAEVGPPAKKTVGDYEEQIGEPSKEKYPKSKMSESISANDIKEREDAIAAEVSGRLLYLYG
jgi:hypothetical protein